MELEQHIQNLKQYIKDQKAIDYSNFDNIFSKFAQSHCEDIQAVLDELNNRIPKEKVDEIIDDYEQQLTEKNNIIFNLQNEREALWDKLEEEFG